MLTLKRNIKRELTVGKFISSYLDRDVILLTESVQVDRLEYNNVRPGEAEQSDLPQVFLSDHSPSLMRMDDHGDMFQKASLFFYAGDYVITDYVVKKDQARLNRDGVSERSFIANFSNHSEWFSRELGTVIHPTDDNISTMFFHSQQVYTGWLDNYSARKARFLTCPQLPYYPTQGGNKIHVMYVNELWFKPWAFDVIVNDPTIKKFAYWRWVETGVDNLMGARHMGEWWGDGSHHPIHVPTSFGAEDGNKPIRTLVVGAGDPSDLHNLRHRLFDFFRDKDYYYFRNSQPDGDSFTDKMVEEFSFRCGEILVHYHSHLSHNSATVDWTTKENIASHLNSWPVFKKEGANPDFNYTRYHSDAYITLREGVNKFVTTTRDYEIWEINNLITDVINRKTYLKPNRKFYSYNQQHANSYTKLIYGEEGMPGWYRVQIPQSSFTSNNGFYLDFGQDNFWSGIPDVSKLQSGQSVVIEVVKGHDNAYFNVILVSYDAKHVMESFLIVKDAYVMPRSQYDSAMQGVTYNDLIRVFGGNKTAGASVKLTNLSSSQVHINFINEVVNDVDSGIVIYDKTTDTASTHGNLTSNKLTEVSKQLDKLIVGKDQDRKKSKVDDYPKDKVTNVVPLPKNEEHTEHNGNVDDAEDNNINGQGDAATNTPIVIGGSYDPSLGSGTHVEAKVTSSSKVPSLSDLLRNKLSKMTDSGTSANKQSNLSTPQVDVKTTMNKRTNAQGAASHPGMRSAHTGDSTESLDSKSAILAFVVALSGLLYTLYDRGGYYNSEITNGRTDINSD